MTDIQTLDNNAKMNENEKENSTISINNDIENVLFENTSTPQNNEAKQMKELCPDFCQGCCFENCNMLHVKCRYELLCYRENCKYGHILTYPDRVVLRGVFEGMLVDHKEKIFNSERCKYRMFCTNEQCKLGHPLDYKGRIAVLNKFKNLRKFKTEQHNVQCNGLDTETENEIINTSSNGCKANKLPSPFKDALLANI
jgi:hypothetical protein